MNTTEASPSILASASETPSAWKDWLGITASIGCAIHCAAMPFVIAWLPALGLRFLADESFHQWMVLACFLIATASFIPGLRRHGSWTPVSVGAIGLCLITFAAFELAGECCSACDATETGASNRPAAVCEVSPAQFEQCDGCDQCGSSERVDDQTVTASDPQKDNQAGLLTILAPWVTPLGGVILVAAHLLNRRYGCLCGCC